MRTLIACGGTGGHIFPAITLAQELKRKGYPDSVFVIDEGMVSKELIRKAGFDFMVLAVPKMPYGFSGKWPLFIIKLIISRLNAKPIVAQINPDIAVGFGAYISGPVMRTAGSMGIKTLIHEQNAFLGRANRMLFNMADRVALSFNSPLKKNAKCTLTGIPIRQELLDGFKTVTNDEALKAFRFSKERKTLLVLGGSRGASAINKAMIDMVKLLPDEKKDSIQIIHIAGHKDCEMVERAYRINKVMHWVRGFYDKMAFSYKASDMVISRAGAATISEIALFGIPALFIPYPWAGSHQRDNAAFIAREGAAVILKESGLSPKKLEHEIFSIISDEDGMRRMVTNMRIFSKPDAAKDLAGAVMELLNAE
jgi:UDP-N-acetylglucosamine--N-acetylmuramyl-(pentapeptide) pyrophosphoryl-undecaprenol N-acetylglucosamine transferase